MHKMFALMQIICKSCTEAIVSSCRPAAPAVSGSSFKKLKF